MRRSLLQVAVLATGFVLMAAPPVSAGTVLISADEAKLPPPAGAVARSPLSGLPIQRSRRCVFN